MEAIRCFVCNKILDTKRLYCRGNRCTAEMLRKAKFSETGVYTYRGNVSHNERHIVI